MKARSSFIRRGKGGPVPGGAPGFFVFDMGWYISYHHNWEVVAECPKR